MAKDDKKKDGKEEAEKDDKKKEDAKEGDAKEGGEGEEGAPAKKSKKKIIIIGVAALVILIGGAAGAYFSGVFKKHDEQAVAGTTTTDGAEKPVFYTMPEFLANLNTGGKQTSYLKTTIILQLAKPTDVQIVEANLPRLFDTFNTYLRELRSSDLAGSAGMQRLREELIVRANQVLAPTKVTDVLFKEIIVQ